ncbi:MAG: four helix bundle protein [Bacteroidota bacterium]
MKNERPHKRLDVWRRAIKMVKRIYEISGGFPKEEEFGLKSQVRRAAVSVPSNIAEGLTRRSKKEKIRFLNISDGSLSELDTQLEIARELGFIGENLYDEAEEMLMEIQRPLSGLIRSIES